MRGLLTCCSNAPVSVGSHVVRARYCQGIMHLAFPPDCQALGSDEWLPLPEGEMMRDKLVALQRVVTARDEQPAWPGCSPRTGISLEVRRGTRNAGGQG